MSFKRTWSTFRIFLMGAMYTDPVSWRAKYELALGYAAQEKLPKRKADRSYLREAYQRRPKSNTFAKRKPPSTPAKSADTG